MKWIKIIIIIIFLLSILAFFFSKNLSNNKISENNEINTNISPKSSNQIQDVSYVSKDKKGNKYTIYASSGEMDNDKPNILFLTEVSAIIELSDSNKIKIFSDYGKYNSNNFDTIFTQNVVVNYLDNKIKGEYLDFSIKRGNMIFSKNIIYTNPENILIADVIDIDIKTKDTKIFMFDKNEKINIKSK